MARDRTGVDMQVKWWGNQKGNILGLQDQFRPMIAIIVTGDRLKTNI